MSRNGAEPCWLPLPLSRLERVLEMAPSQPAECDRRCPSKTDGGARCTAVDAVAFSRLAAAHAQKAQALPRRGFRLSTCRRTLLPPPLGVLLCPAVDWTKKRTSDMGRVAD